MLCTTIIIIIRDAHASAAHLLIVEARPMTICKSKVQLTNTYCRADAIEMFASSNPPRRNHITEQRIIELNNRASSTANNRLCYVIIITVAVGP